MELLIKINCRIGGFLEFGWFCRVKVGNRVDDYKRNCCGLVELLYVMIKIGFVFR